MIFRDKDLVKKVLMAAKDVPEVVMIGPYPVEGSILWLPPDEESMAGRHEKAKVTIFKNIVNDESVVVDVGAHIGYYTILAAHLGAKIYSFEPSSMNYKMLELNIKVNGYKVIAERCALGERKEEKILQLFMCLKEDTYLLFFYYIFCISF